MIRYFDISSQHRLHNESLGIGLCRNAVSESIETMSPARDDDLQPRVRGKCYQPVWGVSIRCMLPPLQHFTETRRKVRKRDRFRL